MKRNHALSLLAMALLAFVSCEKTDPQSEGGINHYSLSQTHVMPRTSSQAAQGNDAIALHVDSIINGHIQTDLISSGFIPLDIDQNGAADIKFEIINLQPYNNNNMPSQWDSLAVRAVCDNTVELLDNSTFGYCDALDANAVIDANGSWNSRTFVLGTFMDAGQFKGKGVKYLAFRMPDQQSFTYGWVELSVSNHNDTLRLNSYAWNATAGNSIGAGQTQ